MAKYSFNRNTITIKTDSIWIPNVITRGFRYHRLKTEKRAKALSILFKGYNPLREETSIDLNRLKELQGQLENIIIEVEKTIK